MDGGNYSDEIKKAHVFTMTPNVERIVEAILLIVNEAKDNGHAVTQYDVVKSLFLADRNHLNRFGRPITYDNYVAMKHGPVPSLAYDILKEKPFILSENKIGKLPWSRREASEFGHGCFSYERPLRQADEDILSPSDLKSLKSALVVVKTLGFRQVRRLTHDDQAYLDAWEDNDDTKSFPMSYTLLFDSPNEERAAAIATLSENI